MFRKYPVGIQSFETIRRDGYIYIDKTPLIYKMISEALFPKPSAEVWQVVIVFHLGCGFRRAS